MNGALKFSIPRNECTSWVSTGAGSLVKALSLSASGESSLLEKITPKNLMLSLLNSHFLGLQALQDSNQCGILFLLGHCRDEDVIINVLCIRYVCQSLMNLLMK